MNFAATLVGGMDRVPFAVKRAFCAGAKQLRVAGNDGRRVIAPARRRTAGGVRLDRDGLDGATGREWNYGELLADPTRLAEALASRFAPGKCR